MVAHPIVYAGIKSAVVATAVGGVVVAAVGTDWVAIIGAVSLALGAVLTPLFYYLNRKLDMAKQAADERDRRTSQTLAEIGSKVDGKYYEEKKALAASSRAEGKLEGVAEERAEPMVPAVSTVKDDSAPPIAPEASKGPKP
jgi:hypothetical protein